MNGIQQNPYQQQTPYDPMAARRANKTINNLEDKIGKYLPRRQLRNVNLRDFSTLQFSKEDLN